MKLNGKARVIFGIRDINFFKSNDIKSKNIFLNMFIVLGCLITVFLSTQVFAQPSGGGSDNADPTAALSVLELMIQDLQNQPQPLPVTNFREKKTPDEENLSEVNIDRNDLYARLISLDNLIHNENALSTSVLKSLSKIYIDFSGNFKDVDIRTLEYFLQILVNLLELEMPFELKENLNKFKVGFSTKLKQFDDYENKNPWQKLRYLNSRSIDFFINADKDLQATDKNIRKDFFNLYKLLVSLDSVFIPNMSNASDDLHNEEGANQVIYLESLNLYLDVMSGFEELYFLKKKNTTESSEKKTGYINNYLLWSPNNFLNQIKSQKIDFNNSIFNVLGFYKDVISLYGSLKPLLRQPPSSLRQTTSIINNFITLLPAVSGDESEDDLEILVLQWQSSIDALFLLFETVLSSGLKDKKSKNQIFGDIWVVLLEKINSLISLDSLIFNKRYDNDTLDLSVVLSMQQTSRLAHFLLSIDSNYPKEGLISVLNSHSTEAVESKDLEHLFKKLVGNMKNLAFMEISSFSIFASNQNEDIGADLNKKDYVHDLTLFIWTLSILNIPRDKLSFLLKLENQEDVNKYATQLEILEKTSSLFKQLLKNLSIFDWNGQFLKNIDVFTLQRIIFLNNLFSNLVGENIELYDEYKSLYSIKEYLNRSDNLLIMSFIQDHLNNYYSNGNSFEYLYWLDKFFTEDFKISDVPLSEGLVSYERSDHYFFKDIVNKNSIVPSVGIFAEFTILDDTNIVFIGDLKIHKIASDLDYGVAYLANLVNIAVLRAEGYQVLVLKNTENLRASLNQVYQAIGTSVMPSVSEMTEEAKQVRVEQKKLKRFSNGASCNKSF